MGKSKAKANRLASGMRAARDAVNVLTSAGFRCLIVEDFALTLHGCSDVSSSVALAVLPTKDLSSPLNLVTVLNILLLCPDDIFKPCQSLKESKKNTVVYIDRHLDYSSTPTTLNVKIKIMDVIIPGYREEESQEIEGLPVISFFPAVIHILHADIVAHQQLCFQTGRQPDKNRAKGLSKALRRTIANWGQKDVGPVRGAEFKTLALPILQSLSQNTSFRPFVAMCRKSFDTAAQVGGSESAISEEIAHNPSLSALLDGKDVVLIFETQVKIDPDVGRWEDTATENEPIADSETKNTRKISAIVEEPTVTHVSAQILVKVAKLIISILDGLEYRSAVLGGDSLYDSRYSSDHIDIIVFRPVTATTSNVRRALMTSLWYQHFHIRRVVGEETLLFQLTSLAAGFDASPRSRIAINIQTPTVGVALSEDDVIDLPVIPSRLLQPQPFTVDVKAASQESPLRTLYEAFNDLGSYREAMGRWNAI